MISRTSPSARHSARFLKFLFSALSLLAVAFAAFAEKPYPEPVQKDRVCYLAAYFLSSGDSPAEHEQIHFAVSGNKNDLHFQALNNDAPVLNAKDFSRSGSVRDPYIIRAEDGGFRMVALDMSFAKRGDSDNGVGIVLMKSDDLIDWSAKSVFFPERFPELKENFRRADIGAPRVIYDPAAKKYLVYLPLPSLSSDGNYLSFPIYGAYANADFTDLETAPQLMFENPDETERHRRQDAVIVPFGGRYHMFFNRKKFVSGTLFPGKWEASESEAGPGFGLETTRISVPGVTGQTAVRPGIYSLRLENTDAAAFSDDSVGKESGSSGNGGIISKTYISGSTIYAAPYYFVRQGSRIAIARSELNALIRKWGTEKMYEPPTRNNPVIEAFYADPGTLYAEKTGKYYIYPTHDGFPGWGGKDFQVFSSSDLKNWKFERTILTLGEDVKWSSGNAWAPCIMERKQPDGSFKYYFYFCGALKGDGRKCIGCAVADDPLGPFVDIGKPVIDFKPEGVRGGQEIDPDVFRDPASGKYYLYWGNGYMAGAELADDMLSVKRDTVKVFRPGRTFREGTNVICRTGKYYFSWSVDDTGSPNYHVRYATADSPLGDLTVPRNNVVIEKDPARGILGTGHHQILKVHGADDEWRIVYHRFAWQNGKIMDGPGFHREVCIDKLEFNPDGSIKQVVPTL